MHEVGLISDAIQQAVISAERAGARQIERLTFAVAPGGHVTPEIVQTLFGALSSGTIAEGASLDFEPRSLRLVCFSCATTYDAPAVDACCPECGAAGMLDADVPELSLVSIDISPQGDPCVAQYRPT
jgi:hydrogenase nickel incorporation protein HypA/HybF